MNTSTHIGINGLFLRKPGSGIGQVTRFFLESLQTLDLQGTPYTLYIDDPEYTFPVGENGKVVYLKPLWKRDDLIRKLLWEHIQLPKEALKDGVTHFLSLYQEPTEFPPSTELIAVLVYSGTLPKEEFEKQTRSLLFLNQLRMMFPTILE